MRGDMEGDAVGDAGDGQEEHEDGHKGWVVTRPLVLRFCGIACQIQYVMMM